MAKRGPKQKSARGFRTKRGPGGDPVRVPAGLSTRAADEYLRVVGRLAEAGRLEAADPNIITAYAMAYDTMWIAYITLEAEGRQVYADSGRPIAHPMVAVQREAAVRLKIYSHTLGLDRAGAGGLRSETDNEWADLLSITG